MSSCDGSEVKRCLEACNIAASCTVLRCHREHWWSARWLPGSRWLFPQLLQKKQNKKKTFALAAGQQYLSLGLEWRDRRWLFCSRAVDRWLLNSCVVRWKSSLHLPEKFHHIITTVIYSHHETVRAKSESDLAKYKAVVNHIAPCCSTHTHICKSTVLCQTMTGWYVCLQMCKQIEL